jgi:hypothetical protein
MRFQIGMLGSHFNSVGNFIKQNLLLKLVKLMLKFFLRLKYANLFSFSSC